MYPLPRDQRLEDVYFMRRMAEARRAPEITTSMAFDLADSGLDDDALELATESFGATAGDRGLGMSEIMEELLSRNPSSVPAGSVRQIQARLQAQGYAPPGATADGHWSPTWASAFRRSDRDAQTAARGAQHALAEPATTFFRYLGATVPSEVWKGMVGMAKGIVNQATGTDKEEGSLERMGALGTGASGAGVGGILGGPAGALIGGVGGAIAGFAADFFGDSEDEGQQSVADKTWDALSPYDEYKKGGMKAFWEDVGFVASAASIALAARTAGGAGTQGLAAIRASGGLRTALTTTGNARTGMIARIAARATPSKSASEYILKSSRYIRGNPLMKMARGPYTAASSAQLAARLTGGLGQGEHDVYQDGKLIADRKGTAIAEGIEEAKPLKTGIEVPVPFLGGDLLDWSLGMVLWPTKLLPGNIGKAGKALNRSLNNAEMDPYVKAAQVRQPDGSFPSRAKARELAMSYLGDTPAERAVSNTFYRIQYGAYVEARERLGNININNPLDVQKRLVEARSDIFRKIEKEANEIPAGTPPDKMRSDTARRVVMHSYNDPTGFTGYLESIEGIGSSLERGKGFREASFLTQEVSEAGLAVADRTRIIRLRDFDVIEMRENAKGMEKRAKAIEAEARSRGTDISTNERYGKIAEAKALREEAATLSAEARRQATGHKEKNLTVIPARKFDPANNDPGYATRGDIEGLADEYERTMMTVQESWKALKDADPQDIHRPMLEKQYVAAQDEANAFILDNLSFRGLLSDAEKADAMVPKDIKKIGDLLRKKAELRGVDAEVPEEVAKRLDELGYKPVATGESVLHFHKTADVIETAGVGEYARRQKFYAGVESMGMGLGIRPDRKVGEYRYAATEGELQQVLKEEGILQTGKGATKELTNYLERDHQLKKGVAAKGPFVVESGKMLRLPKIDLRQLNGDNIVEALDLVKRAPEGKDPYEIAGKIYKAIHRGANWGGEINLRHPREMLSQLGKSLSISGLPGFANFTRTVHVVPSKKGTYGYLPERAWNATLAFRYALSPLFDASRLVEQNAMGILKGEGAIPLMLKPLAKIRKQEWQHSPYTSRPVTGDEAVEHMHRWYDQEIRGKKQVGPADEVERRFEQVGILGFNPRNWEAAQSWQLMHQRAGMNGGAIGKKDIEEIREKVMEIGRYGTGRSAAEKSIHFIMFPFSFQKKFYGAIADFATSGPLHNVLIHEGLRRYDQLAESGKLNEFMEKYAPIAAELGKLNNFAYGISPGRFTLEGVKDPVSGAGKAAEALTAFFLPGGAMTPAHQAAGMTSDVLKNLFVPVALDETGVAKLGRAVDRVIPAIQDMNALWNASGDQLLAVTEGGAPDWQLSNYFDDRAQAKADLKPLAALAGFDDVDSFLASDIGMGAKVFLDEEELEISRKYPLGSKMAMEFSVDTEVKKRVIADIAEDPDRSEAEDEILDLVEQREGARLIAQTAGLAQEDVIALVTSQIRKQALKHVDNPEFVRLWDQLLSDDFAPITMVP